MMKNNLYKFFDTSALLAKPNCLFGDQYTTIISSITLQELKEIIASDYETLKNKTTARKLLNEFKEHTEQYENHIFTKNMLKPIREKNFIITNNNFKILATALDYDKNIHPDEVVFVTANKTLANIANLFFGEDSIELVL